MLPSTRFCEKVTEKAPLATLAKFIQLEARSKMGKERFE
jgi:hypothetical protein